MPAIQETRRSKGGQGANEALDDVVRANAHKKRAGRKGEENLEVETETMHRAPLGVMKRRKSVLRQGEVGAARCESGGGSECRRWQRTMTAGRFERTQFLQGQPAVHLSEKPCRSRRPARHFAGKINDEKTQKKESRGRACEKG